VHHECQWCIVARNSSQTSGSATVTIHDWYRVVHSRHCRESVCKNVRKLENKYQCGKNFFRKALIIIQNLMFLVVFIDKSDRFADLPYSAATKMASVRAVSTRSKYDFNKNNRISGNRCSYIYMDWHKKSIGLVKFALDSSNLNAVRRFTHLLYIHTIIAACNQSDPSLYSTDKIQSNKAKPRVISTYWYMLLAVLTDFC
jgi:hypothetical protein